MVARPESFVSAPPCDGRGGCDHGGLPRDVDRLQAVLFDWDGTLVDSHNLNYRGLASACAEWGLTMDSDFYLDRVGASGAELITELATRADLTVPVERIDATAQVNILAGVRQLRIHRPVVRLAEELGRRLPLAVVSAGPRRSVHAGLKAMALRHHFGLVVTGEDAARGKPEPDLFIFAAKKLGAEPGGCLVYEDSPAGIAAAEAAGMRVVDVRCFRGRQPGEPAREKR
ncbi:beta-phosphoglucomutase family hydrolase [Streptomyces marokkonensis]|uniref:Beta-phosphoglucomutase family hydrolase n=1 Tax=Streptomyces marokkonensis TaxID=324855 RepID=A0ABP7SC39_9ACTN